MITSRVMSVVEHGPRQFVVVSAVMLAALLQLADTTIVNVALPTIDGNLGASLDEGTWFITSYIIANVIVIPLSPWLSTRFGRRNYFVFSIFGFTLMSLLCGLANDVNVEIAFRFLQGAFGGGLMVPGQQIMRDTFAPSQLGRGQSLFGLAATIGPTIGPTLGGVLTDSLSWRWCFFINLIPGIAAGVLALVFLRDPEPARRTPVDGVGIGLLAVGIGCLQYVLEEGERNGWFEDGTILVISIISAIGLIAFVWWELFGTDHPAIPLRVLRERPVWATGVIGFAVGAMLYGMFIVQPQYTQGTLGFTTTGSGIFMMLRAGTILALFPFTTWLVSRRGLDLRIVIGVGLATYGAASWLQAGLMTSTADFGVLVATQIAGGAGFALIFVPLNVALLQSIGPATVGPALAILRLAQQIGGSVASAWIVTYVDRMFSAHDAVLRSSIADSSQAVHAYMSHAHGGISGLAAIVRAQAQVMALDDAMRVVAFMAFGSVALVFMLRRGLPAKPKAPV